MKYNVFGNKRKPAHTLQTSRAKWDRGVERAANLYICHSRLTAATGLELVTEMGDVHQDIKGIIRGWS
jgi:hypothetical protein